MNFPVIAEFYMFSAIVGTLVLVASALLGGLGQGHMGGRGGLHIGGGHGHAGHLGAAQHGIGGHALHPDSLHQSTGGQAAIGHQGAPTGHNASTQAANQAYAAGQNNAGELAASSSRLPAAVGKSQSTLLLIVTLLNPTTMSSFAIWFGAFGLFSFRLLPFLPIEFTLPIALGAGFLGTRLTLRLMSMLSSRMYASGSFRQEQLIGYEAEVTVSVDFGHLGEIICVGAGSRYSFSARSAHPGQSFKRGSRVIISDIQNDTAFVESWPDEDFPLDDSGSGTAKIPASEPDKLPESPN